ncbi:MAG: trypsin-like peptidase domain-containing protein, partial [Ignavibacteriaceae bacterium]|nr:trypsin-like peptidase domain-containing protein [Ignavibacteriaceae bacterium]
MHFNGHTVDVKLYISCGDPGSIFNIDYLLVSDPFVYADNPQCLNDNRISFSHNAIGRIHTAENIIGTAWIAGNGLIITAGHFFPQGSSRSGWIYFNVPNSTGGGNPQFPNSEKAYQFTNVIAAGGNVEGEDWAVLQVLPNNMTGLYPADNAAQGTSITLTNEYLTNIPVRVAGYGVDEGTSNLTLQSSSGTYLRNNNPLEYSCFAIDGVSGGPVLKTDGKAMGIHTHIACHLYQEANLGTGFKYDAAWYYINQPYQFIDVQINQYLEGNTHKEKIGLFVNSSAQYRNYHSGKIFKFLPNQSITLLSDTLVYQDQKFWNWTPTAYENHNNFSIISSISEITSQFKQVKNNLEINYISPESNSTLSNLNLRFKDPWYTQKTQEYIEGIYGYRNLGLNAIYHTRPAPFKPRNFINGGNNDIGSYYKGVFLDQDYLDPNKPYYSVQAISPQTCTLAQTGREHTFYFQNWSANT